MFEPVLTKNNIEAMHKGGTALAASSFFICPYLAGCADADVGLANSHHVCSENKKNKLSCNNSIIVIKCSEN